MKVCKSSGTVSTRRNSVSPGVLEFRARTNDAQAATETAPDMGGRDGAQGVGGSRPKWISLGGSSAQTAPRDLRRGAEEGGVRSREVRKSRTPHRSSGCDPRASVGRMRGALSVAYEDSF